MTPPGVPDCELPMPKKSAFPTVVTPESLLVGSGMVEIRFPDAASRTWISGVMPSGTNVIPPATVVGPNDWDASACQATVPVAASNACMLGSWNG